MAVELITTTQKRQGTKAERLAMNITGIPTGSEFSETDTGKKYKTYNGGWVSAPSDSSSSNGTQVDTDKTLTWAASTAANTRQNISFTIPENVSKQLVFSFVNQSRISDMTVEIGNTETTLGTINLGSVTVPKAIAALVEDCEDAWDSAQGANVTCSADAAVVKVGTNSAKMAIGADAAVGLISSETVSAANLSDKTHIAAWIYSSVALAAGDLQFNLDNSAACASPLESINIPAIAATTWTKVYLPLANPTSDVAIVSVGVSMLVDKGAFNLYIDDVYAIKQGTNAVEVEGIRAGTCQVGVINDTILGATDDAYFYARAREV